MSVQIGVGLGARQRDGIDIRADNQASAASSGNPGKHTGTRSYIQNRFRLPLPAEQVHGGGTQTRGCVRPVSKDCGKAWRLRQLCKGYPAFSYRRGRAAGGIYRDSRSDLFNVLRSECAHRREVITATNTGLST